MGTRRHLDCDPALQSPDSARRGIGQSPELGLAIRKAFVLTVSDGVAAGVRDDLSGEALRSLLSSRGFEVESEVVPDEVADIEASIRHACAGHELVVTTGGTGLGPRDVTPEATQGVLDREMPGLRHLMMAKGLESTPMAALSRANAGAVGESLVVNVPGSTRGATESLQAIIDVIPHALDLLAGDTEHR
ncbi:MAG: MogA/MoaB family molybdenum cofactor biosynthesis protein [Acidimicrobiia bacterium]